MTKKNIYIVMGTTGEYSDRNEWPVVAYHDEVLAQQHVLLATEKAKEIEVRMREYAYPYPQYHNPYDPDMSQDYTGTDYYIYIVPIARALPEVPASFQLIEDDAATLRKED